jgi:hypothetical protein
MPPEKDRRLWHDAGFVLLKIRGIKDTSVYIFTFWLWIVNRKW